MVTSERSSSLRTADVRNLEACGARVWQWSLREVCRIAAVGGWRAEVTREGFAPMLAVETWYDDGTLVVACRARSSVSVHMASAPTTTAWERTDSGIYRRERGVVLRVIDHFGGASATSFGGMLRAEASLGLTTVTHECASEDDGRAWCERGADIMLREAT